jgi:MSHA biogenesis protein MshG
MPFFAYKGRNAKGDLVQGVQEASDSGGLAALLLNSGVTPIDISATSAPKTEDADELGSLFAEKITTVDLMMFSRQMYTLLKAGIPIMNALGGLQASTVNKKLAGVIGDIRQSLDSGRELSVAMREHPKVFSPFYLSMIRVGEGTGLLDTVFIRMFDHLEFEKFMRDQVKAALRYPSFVMIAMAVAIGIINIFVIPAFAKVFKGFNAELPLMTRILIGFSDFMVNNWLFLLLLLVGVIFGFKSWVATSAGKYKWDKIKLRIPIAGKIVQKATLARFARSFALAAKSGVPIVQAMTLIAETVDNDYIADKVTNMRSGIERGESVLRTAANSGIFTPIVLQMIAVGEESGALDDLMQEIADMYQREVEYELKTLGAQIEPIMIVFLGILVLVLALGIFLPIWDLGKAALGKH